MSVTWMQDWERDPAAYVRRQLEALNRLDRDRLAFIRQQRGAASSTAKTAPPHLAPLNSGEPNNPETPNAA